MKLHFSIHYQTTGDETLYVVIHREDASLRTRKISVPLTYSTPHIWQGEVHLLLQHPLRLHYHYEVRKGPKTLRREWQTVARCLPLKPTAHAYFLYDQWRDLPPSSWLYTTCMTDIFHKRPSSAQELPLFEHTLLLRVQTPRPQPEEELYLCGSCKELGNWDPQQALRLAENSVNEWSISLNATRLTVPFEYKFFLRNKDTGEIVWEQGPNRYQQNLPWQPKQIWIQSDLRPHFPASTPFRAAGVVIPVFSLKSNGSFGVGDFGDLIQLIDWAIRTGQKVIQLLPVNDTTLTKTWRDSYPYNALSVYALHPIYADMRQLPPLHAWQEKRIEKKRQKLNNLPELDYERTLRFKLKRLQQAFKQEGARVLTSSPFRTFWQENAHWLPAYAMFCTLRDTYHCADFSRWPEHAVFSANDLHTFCAPHSAHQKNLHFWYYVQFILHTQLSKAARYAHQHGVMLKGDIPIGISPHSVDAWMNPVLFNLNAQAGAPPDDFSATGQNWGFPTYNWEHMAQNGYRWWIHRFTHMARYFDAYRIDHVLGFFRIWEIPSHAVDGLLGQFVPAQAFTLQEISQYGLPFKLSFAQPYISKELVQQLFGNQAQKVTRKFLYPLAGTSLFKLRPQYNTQRQIQAFFQHKTGAKAEALRRGLYTLTANVLFVPDRADPLKFHPRIAALSTTAFAALSTEEQAAYTRLYNDYFFHRHNRFWAQEALKKLPILTQCTRMLCCAEDLGMIPTCVPYVMRELQMLSLEIQRMPKELGPVFADTHKYPYLSVATPSTHDMSVLRAWWKEDREKTQQFWHDILHRSGPAPQEADGQTCADILNLHLKSPSMLVLIGWQDWLSIDEKLRAANPEKERINIPAEPHHYWRYRMHLTLEKLLEETSFNNRLKKMIAQSGR